MLGRALLMLLGVIVLSGVALAVTKACTTLWRVPMSLICSLATPGRT
jgi:hypothetical protein